MLWAQLYIKINKVTKINIYTIQKTTKDDYDKLVQDFIIMCSKYAKVTIYNIFNKNIAKAHTINELTAKKSYTIAYLPYLKNFNIALDVKGKQIDSFKFSKLLENHSEINFFVGGAYGFEENFLRKCTNIISLSTLTMAHKIVHLVLFEQIFRALSIKNNHPYHK